MPTDLAENGILLSTICMDTCHETVITEYSNF